MFSWPESFWRYLGRAGSVFSRPADDQSDGAAGRRRGCRVDISVEPSSRIFRGSPGDAAAAASTSPDGPPRRPTSPDGPPRRRLRTAARKSPSARQTVSPETKLQETKTRLR